MYEERWQATNLLHTYITTVLISYLGSLSIIYIDTSWLLYTTKAYGNFRLDDLVNVRYI